MATAAPIAPLRRAADAGMRAPVITRHVWVVLHRWAGLTIAFFLIIAGATGAVLPFQQELALASRPSLSAAAPPTSGARPLSGPAIAEWVARATGGTVSFVPLTIAPDHIAALSVAGRHYDTVWADPYTGRVRAAFRYGVLADGPQNIVPFLYRLHMNLALGPWGTWAMGMAALIWSLDCFVGFYLTLPRRSAMPAKSWWTRWGPAWRVRRARGHKLHFDLHRASGLWLWPLLFVFAWSGVAFNLPAVHRPVMRTLGASADYQPPTLPAALSFPPMGIVEAQRTGRALIRHEAATRGFTVTRQEGYLYYLPTAGAWLYAARTSLDPSHDQARTALWFSATDGRLLHFLPPLGSSRADAATQWFYLLHMAQVGGLPYRLFVSLLGLIVCGLSVTGVLLWTRKRTARLLATRNRVHRGAGERRDRAA